MNPSPFKKLSIEELPLSDDGNCYFDLYVNLPLNARYVRYVAAGDELDDRRRHAIATHVDPAIYVYAPEFSGWLSAAGSGLDTFESEGLAEGQVADSRLRHGYRPAPGESGAHRIAAAKTGESKLIRIAGAAAPLGVAMRVVATPGNGTEKPGGERFTREEEVFLREPIRDELLSLYRDLRTEHATGGDELDRIESVTARLLRTIAPDVESLRSLLAQNAKYIYVMSDAAAITSLAVLFAVAKNFSSRNVFKDLAYSAILMDLGLSELNEAELRQYYIDRERLPPAAKRIAREHPAASYKMLRNRLRTMSDICGQLIANHHELYGGQGFPRGVRSDLLAPLTRVLALAVDVFERLKRAQILGEQLGLRDAVVALRDENVEPHLRRHSRKLTEEVLALLDVPEMSAIFR